MKKISRTTFLKVSALGLAGVANPYSLLGLPSHGTHRTPDDELLMRSVQTNDRSVARIIASRDTFDEARYLRSFSNTFATLTASYCHPRSDYHRSPEVLESMTNVIDRLLAAQYPNGTMDSGGNRQSPPDTAFYLENLCPAAGVLRQADLDQSSEVREKLESFLLSAGEALKTGGVHTPNHRWVVSAMLARLHQLFDDEKYVQRLDQWLAEGIYINQDGNYPERSRNYSLVVNNSLVTIGRLLDRPDLFDIVRRNLKANYYYMEPDGDLITLDSRRQDQYSTIEMARYYFLYKYLAHHYEDEFFGAIATEIEGFESFERHVLSDLIVFMDEPILLSSVRAAPQLPVDYTKEFPDSGLVRIRRGDTTASLFGGNDKPLVIASGRSVSPTFFTYRKGSAILHSARLSTSFFSTGYVRSDGVVKNGNQYVLSERKEAYYYHPMPADKRNEDGDYKLSPSVDDRFWSKMDFENRPKDTIALESRIMITETSGSFQMDFEVDGPSNVDVILEFCFNHGGELEGVSAGQQEDDYFLKSGTAKYTYGGDVIEIGPGAYAHDNLRGLDGEVYSTHFGTIKGEGLHVYLTGLTPFRHSVIIK